MAELAYLHSIDVEGMHSMVKSAVALEDMTDEQLKTLLAFLRAAIGDAEVEAGWREEESAERLPLLRGLVHHLSTEFLGEAPENEFEYDHDDGDDDTDELDF